MKIKDLQKFEPLKYNEMFSIHIQKSRNKGRNYYFPQLNTIASQTLQAKARHKISNRFLSQNNFFENKEKHQNQLFNNLAQIPYPSFLKLHKNIKDVKNKQKYQQKKSPNTVKEIKLNISKTEYNPHLKNYVNLKKINLHKNKTPSIVVDKTSNQKNSNNEVMPMVDKEQDTNENLIEKEYLEEMISNLIFNKSQKQVHNYNFDKILNKFEHLVEYINTENKKNSIGLVINLLNDEISKALSVKQRIEFENELKIKSLLIAAKKQRKKGNIKLKINKGNKKYYICDTDIDNYNEIIRKKNQSLPNLNKNSNYNLKNSSSTNIPASRNGDMSQNLSPDENFNSPENSRFERRKSIFELEKHDIFTQIMEDISENDSDGSMHHNSKNYVYQDLIKKFTYDHPKKNIKKPTLFKYKTKKVGFSEYGQRISEIYLNIKKNNNNILFPDNNEFLPNNSSQDSTNVDLNNKNSNQKLNAILNKNISEYCFPAFNNGQFSQGSYNTNQMSNNYEDGKNENDNREMIKRKTNQTKKTIRISRRNETLKDSVDNKDDLNDENEKIQNLYDTIKDYNNSNNYYNNNFWNSKSDINNNFSQSNSSKNNNTLNINDYNSSQRKYNSQNKKGTNRSKFASKSKKDIYDGIKNNNRNKSKKTTIIKNKNNDNKNNKDENKKINYVSTKFDERHEKITNLILQQNNEIAQINCELNELLYHLEKFKNDKKLSHIEKEFIKATNDFNTLDLKEKKTVLKHFKALVNVLGDSNEKHKVVNKRAIKRIHFQIQEYVLDLQKKGVIKIKKIKNLVAKDARLYLTKKELEERKNMIGENEEEYIDSDSSVSSVMIDFDEEKEKNNRENLFGKHRDKKLETIHMESIIIKNSKNNNLIRENSKKNIKQNNNDLFFDKIDLETIKFVPMSSRLKEDEIERTMERVLIAIKKRNRFKKKRKARKKTKLINDLKTLNEEKSPKEIEEEKKRKKKELFDKRLQEFFNKIQRLKNGKGELFDKELKSLIDENLEQLDYTKDKENEFRMNNFYSDLELSRNKNKYSKLFQTKKYHYLSPLMFDSNDSNKDIIRHRKILNKLKTKSQEI